MAAKFKTIVVGAGPVGALAAIYAAQRGHDVEIYELRNAATKIFRTMLELFQNMLADGDSDLRDPSTTPLNFTKSINLALSERGIFAMKNANRPDLVTGVMAETIPMRGRMIHGKRVFDSPKSSLGSTLYEEPQDYDVHGRVTNDSVSLKLELLLIRAKTIFAVDRGGLNKRLLDELESMPNVKFFFNHKMTGADFRKQVAWFEQKELVPLTQARPKEIEISFDLLIGADGAHSASRYHLMKFTRMNYRQEYIDTLWCEFRIEPKDKYDDTIPGSRFQISQHYLHIWPSKDKMFIAIPSLDESFTCTLFMPSRSFVYLENAPDKIEKFFDDFFPGVTSLISPKNLVKSFQTNPHLPLVSIKCSPYHFTHCAVILGDAAHAMVPFYGQGMNSGLEDVRILFETLDKYTPLVHSNGDVIAGADPNPAESPRERALAKYSETRSIDAAAINDLALENYTEMRASVISPTYRLRKFFEEALLKHFPSLGWQTKYSRVSFGNERYSEVIRQSERQHKLIVRGLVALLASPLIGAAFWAWRSLKRM